MIGIIRTWYCEPLSATSLHYRLLTRYRQLHILRLRSKTGSRGGCRASYSCNRYATAGHSELRNIPVNLRFFANVGLLLSVQVFARALNFLYILYLAKYVGAE